MDLYETASIALVETEDVIAASTASCEEIYDHTDCDRFFRYVLHLPDGSTKEYGPGIDSSDAGVPEEYQDICE